MAHPLDNIKCSHPDHIDGYSCEDRAVGCSKYCICCMGALAEREFLKDVIKEMAEEIRNFSFQEFSIDESIESIIEDNEKKVIKRYLEERNKER